MHKKNLNAPIVLFAYARPEHTNKTIDSLKNNLLASESDLHVFLDYPKKSEHIDDYNKVKDIVENVNGFNSVQVIKRETNFGLAKNIMTGVSELVEKFGRVIVLEDDLVTSEYFLTYMNEALDRYENDKEVWHISGWTHPINFEIDEDTFAWRTMNCWGWATWHDRWKYFSKEPQILVDSFTKKDINKFNLDNTHNFWGQVTANLTGRLNTWAIFWYATIFQNNGVCINPTTTYVQNIGNDGSGENCGQWDIFTSILAEKSPQKWTTDFTENPKPVAKVKAFYKKNYPNIIVRAFRKFHRLFMQLLTK